MPIKLFIILKKWHVSISFAHCSTGRTSCTFLGARPPALKETVSISNYCLLARRINFPFSLNPGHTPTPPPPAPPHTEISPLFSPCTAETQGLLVGRPGGRGKEKNVQPLAPNVGQKLVPSRGRQSWALSVFLNVFNNKKWFFSSFIKWIWLGVGFLNRTGAEIGY